MLVTGHDHLGDALAGLDGEGFAREVHERHAQLAAEIGVHRAGGIDHSDSVLGGEAASGANLRLIPHGKLNENPGGNEGTLQTAQNYGFVYIGVKVHAGGSDGGVGRQVELAVVYNLDFHCAINL